MAPNYGAEGFEASLKCTVSYVEKEKVKGSAELTWLFDVAASTVTELTLEEINTRYVSNGNKIGDMDGLQVGTRGIVTSSFEDSEAHLYAGVFIQDGEHSLQLYAGSLRSLWVENNVKVGDCVFVVGPLSFYGVIEMKPTMLEVVNKAENNIADPVTINLDNKTFDGATLMANQSSLTSISNVTYVSGNVKTTSAHATIKFSHGETEIPVYVNYHIGETAMNAIKALVETYTTSTVISVRGILSFYDGNPQIIPIFGTDSFIAAQAA